MHITFWGSSKETFAPLMTESLQAAGHSVSQESASADVIVLSGPSFRRERLEGQCPPQTRIVMLNSFRVYRAAAQFERGLAGDPITAPLSEQAPLRTSADLAMVNAETELQRLPQPWVILRMPEIFGPGWPALFGRYLSQMDAKRPALLLEPGQANWRCTHGYIRDVANAIAVAATHPQAERQIYNLGERDTPTIAERLHLLARAAGYKGKILVVPERMAPAHLKDELRDYRNDIIMDTGRIRRELGYTDTTPEKQIWAETVAWERSQMEPFKMTDEQVAAEDEVLRKFGLLSRK